MSPRPDRDQAATLLESLLAIPSLSGDESEAATWLTATMAELGYERTRVDEAGNAVGELGEPDAERTVVLLGHIDTVPGAIPVRVEGRSDGGRVLYGRGAVDAKGPLATFVAAGSRLGGDWARRANLRLVVVGAVEEEAATSKGARFIRNRFGGNGELPPTACIIGEPSRWDRVTLGYKGRVLIELEARRAITHTAGPEAGIATVAFALWSLTEKFCHDFNEGIDRAFEQLLPSLRGVNTDSDGLEETVTAKIGIRLPPKFVPGPMLETFARWAAGWTSSPPPPPPTIEPGLVSSIELEGEAGRVRLAFDGYEPAWKSESRSPLVRSFLTAIRASSESGTKPGFVVKTGTSDMNVVGPAWRCPILAYGPGDSRLDHTPNEHISLDEYWQAIQVLERALRNLAESE